MLEDRSQRILNSSFVSKYFKSLFSLGNNNKSRILVAQVVFGASVLLSVASLYTTALGLSELVHFTVAIIIALGIQGLLFGASWRLGVVWGTDESSISLRGIYIITFMCSVSFSYVSLFGTLYPSNQRTQDDLDAVRKEAFAIYGGMNEDVLSSVDTIISRLQSDYQKWYEDSRFSVESKVNQYLGPYRNNIAIYNEMDRIAEVEKRQGYDPNSSGGGAGPIYRRLRMKADKYYQESVAPYGYQVIQMDSSFSTFVSLSKEILSDPKYVTNQNFNTLNSAFQSITALLSDINTTGVPDSILYKVRDVSPLSEFVGRSVVPFDTISTIKNLKNRLITEVNMLAENSLFSKQEYLEEAISIDKFTGENYHPFAVAMFQLVPRFNVLAVFAFIIAFFIDLLVLACGILGSSPQSVLAIKSTDKIEEYSEDAIQSSLLAIAITNGTTYIEEIEKFINLIEPSLESARQQDIPAKIPISKVTDGALLSLMSSLITLKLVKLPKGFTDEMLKNAESDFSNKEYYLGINIRLLLWLNEQLILHSEANEAFTKFVESLKI